MLQPVNGSLYTTRTDNMEDSEREVEPSRLEIISNKRKTDGMNEALITHLNKAIRTSTNKAYEGYWKKYAIWCQENDNEAEAYNTHQILNYLTTQKHLQYSTLNGYRSAIASALRVLYPMRPPIAEDPTIVGFFKAKGKQEVKIPSETKLETWDMNILVSYISRKLPHNHQLSLYDLQQKTILLLCLHTMWRPRSDIGRIQYRDVHIRYNSITQQLEGVSIHVREPKEAQQKFTILGILEDVQQHEVCIVRVLELFIQRTQEVRRPLPEGYSLFLTYLQEDKKDASTSARPSTVANWVKDHMKKAGINEEYTPHSIRSAASTKAVELGNSIAKVKDHANWSRDSNTFEHYYYKPSFKQHSSTKIQNSIFTTENNTTSESETKATVV